MAADFVVRADLHPGGVACHRSCVLSARVSIVGDPSFYEDCPEGPYQLEVATTANGAFANRGLMIWFYN